MLTDIELSFIIRGMETKKQKQLSVKEIESVLDMSYPTALKFAAENGIFIETETGRGKWYVDRDIVQARINRELVTAQQKQIKLEMLG